MSPFGKVNSLQRPSTVLGAQMSSEGSATNSVVTESVLQGILLKWTPKIQERKTNKQTQKLKVHICLTFRQHMNNYTTINS